MGLLSWIVILFSYGCLLEGPVCPENNLVDCTASSVKRGKGGDESSVGLPAKTRETTQKVVLVTGASSGIGQAVVEEFSRHPNYIVYGSTRQDSLVGTKRERGGEYRLIKMDPGNTDSVNDAVGEVIKAEGRINILINNAGYMVLGSVESVDPDDQLLPLFNVNVVGYMRTTAAVLPVMREHMEGLIVNVTSVQSFEPRSLQASYSATRSAVEALSLAQDSYLRGYGVRVVVFEPGAVSTNIAIQSKLGCRRVKGDFATEPLGSGLNVQEALQSWMIERVKKGSDPEVIAKRLLAVVCDAGFSGFRYQSDEAAERRAMSVYGTDFNGVGMRRKLREKFSEEKALWDEHLKGLKSD